MWYAGCILYIWHVYITTCWAISETYMGNLTAGTLKYIPTQENSHHRGIQS